jgi:hypothetical protein
MHAADLPGMSMTSTCMCGLMHVCADGSCDVERNDQGHDIWAVCEDAELFQ